MTISSGATRKAGPYTGDGVTTTFSFPFKVFSTSDVLVTQTVVSGLTNTDTVLTMTSQYTVSLNSNQDSNPGGTVTVLSPPPLGQLITIGSNMPYTQTMLLTNAGGFFPTVLNDMADRLVIQTQQLEEQISRCFTVPFSTSLNNYSNTIQSYQTQAAQSASAANASAIASASSASTAAGSASASASSAGASSASATASAGSAVSAAASAATAGANAALVLANYVDMFYPSPAQMYTFTQVYQAGGWDLGTIVLSTFPDETTRRCVNLSVDPTASFNFGTVP